MPRHRFGNGAKARQSNSAKVEPQAEMVSRSIATFIESGHANCEIIGDGEIELRLDTGETFLLRATTITRVA